MTTLDEISLTTIYKESSDKIHNNIVMHKGTLNIHSFVLIFVRQ